MNVTAVDRDLDSLLDYSISAVVATDLQGNHIVNGIENLLVFSFRLCGYWVLGVFRKVGTAIALVSVAKDCGLSDFGQG